jgi:Gas vesicle synthesis protein GvpL/GvpF
MLLYAVMPADTPAPDGPGLANHQLEAIRSAHAAMIVEECPDRITGTNEESRTFAEILCNLPATTPMLPIRFPTMLPTRSAVLAELQANEAAWSKRLAELRGLSEVVIRAQWRESDEELDAAAGRSGTSYLEGRAAALRRRDDMVAEISQLVRDWAREMKVLPSQRGIRIACLVSRPDIPQLRHAVLSWQQAGDHGEVVVGGPWPPFSFVADQEAKSA